MLLCVKVQANMLSQKIELTNCYSAQTSFQQSETQICFNLYPQYNSDCQILSTTTVKISAFINTYDTLQNIPFYFHDYFDYQLTNSICVDCIDSFCINLKAVTIPIIIETKTHYTRVTSGYKQNIKQLQCFNSSKLIVNQQFNKICYKTFIYEKECYFIKNLITINEINATLTVNFKYSQQQYFNNGTNIQFVDNGINSLIEYCIDYLDDEVINASIVILGDYNGLFSTSEATNIIEIYEYQRILTLNSENQEIIYSIPEFFVFWSNKECAACVEKLNILEEFMSDKNDTLVVVNCDENDKFCRDDNNQYHVIGYPGVAVMRNKQILGAQIILKNLDNIKEFYKQVKQKYTIVLTKTIHLILFLKHSQRTRMMIVSLLFMVMSLLHMLKITKYFIRLLMYQPKISQNYIWCTISK
ncbi:Thioredoxin-like_superfamily [Hexamita inflata]|uniref:Thioredoxin-like superfamily n=1 Tax=Hexamita inflata TaxID=28002 RepID=A0AA86RP68_9EUKA|nr:Thioredoxin-like superfamily [Hexamita inflata]